MPTCNDLRLGGTLSGTGITGGVSINEAGITVDDWSALFGSAGIYATPQAVNGRWGSILTGDKLGRDRYPILSILLTGRTTVCPPTGGREERLQTNTDTFLELLTEPDGNYLEVDMPDGSSRFLYVYNLTPGDISQPEYLRSISAPLYSPYAYWKQGGNQVSQVVSGATVVAAGGNREVSDAVLSFAGNGTFTHSGLGWAIQVTGASTFPVVVDLGARTVISGGSPGTNLIRRTPAPGKGRVWGWFAAGDNSVTSTVSVTVTLRPSWA